jgi:hypothetical protein
MLKSVTSSRLAFGVVVLLCCLVLALFGAGGGGGAVVGWGGVRARVWLGVNADDSVDAGVPAIGLLVGVAGDSGLDCVLVVWVAVGMVFRLPRYDLGRWV